MADEFDGPYVIRHARTGRAVAGVALLTLLAASTFTPFGAGVGRLPLLIAPVPLWIAAACAGRRTIAELDRHGITVHRVPPLRDRPEFAPWSEVLSVDWRTYRHNDVLTVTRRAPAAVAPALDPGRSEIDDYLVNTVGLDTVSAYWGAAWMRRATTLSDLDPVLLVSALTRLAPQVRIFGPLGELALDLFPDNPAATDAPPEGGP
ncbi:hypothetical protein [Kitasatospora sp. NPDC004531]